MCTTCGAPVLSWACPMEECLGSVRPSLLSTSAWVGRSHFFVCGLQWLNGVDSGIAHFSENWGYLTMSPAVGGNVFSLAFGRNFDAHLPTPPPETQTAPSTHPQCLDGRLCYSSSLHMTIIACFVALLLALWAGYRDRRKMRAHADETRKDWRTRVAVVWDGGET
jgi:hypothetical protein